MNAIPLRAYNREIEEALEQKLTEEAIAHCRHILKVFPKHINTYRLLGKAYLESQRYGNAADIFQRVLSSLPDDFVSHVGMSIIREDEGNLDAAIWHMERAFESQPYNTAIQGELRRLYGRRDGMEPPKIRMTRGALARMYGKSDLYDQAISEIRSNLVEDPQRADLEVLLAQMYIKNGQQTDAVQVCSSLLKRLPYCIEPNRYLSLIFSSGERSDELKTYRQRLEALDPYEAHTSARMPNAEDVPDQAVTINRLDWDGGTMISKGSDQPEWATSIGVQLDEMDSDEHDLPDWLSDSSEESPDPQAARMEASGEDIPGWMQQAGWGPSSGEFDESKSVFDLDETPTDRDEAIAGDIPAWLQDIAPQDALGEDLDLTAGSSDLPSWLMEEADGASDTIVNWLDDKGKEPGIGIPSDDEGAITGSTPAGDASPDWLQELDGSGQDAPIDELPDWLTGLDDAEPADVDETLVASSQEIETPSGDELADIPDWLVGMTDEPSIPTRDYTDKSHQATGATDIPDWLQGIGEGAAGITPAIPNLDPDQTESQDIPDWLQGMGDEMGQEDELEDEASEIEPAEIPDWLKDLEGATGELEAPEPITFAETTDEDSITVPDWLQGIGDEMPQEDEAGEIEPAETPDWLKDLEDATGELEAPEPVTFAETTDEDSTAVPDWLQGIGDEMPQEDEAGEIEPAEIPDWLKEMGGEIDEPEVPEVISLAEAAQEDGTEVPDWLQQLGEEIPSEVEPADETVEIESAEIPDWLMDLEEVEAESPTLEAIAEEPGILSGALEDEEVDITPSVSLEDLAGDEPVEIPEWLQEMGEEQARPTSKIPALFEDEAVDDAILEAEPGVIPDWLEGLGEQDQDTVSMEEPQETPDQVEPVEVPDWLEDITKGEPVSTVPSGVTGWLRSIDEEKLDEMVIDYEPGELPEWLESMVKGRSDSPEEPTEGLPLDFESEPAVEAELNQEGELEPMLETPDFTQTAEVETIQEVMEDEIPTSAAVDRVSEEPDLDFDFEDADAAMAWLEGLAAKQGVSEEELLTKPEDRLETPPQWVQAEIEATGEAISPEGEDVHPEILESETEPAEITAEILDFEEEGSEVEMPAAETEPVSELPEWLGELDEDEAFSTEVPEIVAEAPEIVAEAPIEESLPEFDLDDADAAMAWLEGLAAKQGVSEDELLTSPEERSEEPPQWVKEEIAGEPEADVPDWLRATLEDAPVLDEALVEAAPEEIEPEELPEWLKVAYDSDSIAQEETIQEYEEPVLEETEIFMEDLAEIPEFLREAYEGEALEEPSEVVGGGLEPFVETEMELPIEEMTSAEALAEPDEILTEEIASDRALEAPTSIESETPQPEFDIEPPDWVLAGEEPQEKEYVWLPGDELTDESETAIQLDLNEASMIQLERLSPLGFRRAQAIVTYRNENGPFEDLSELLLVPGIDQGTLEELRSLLWVKPALRKEIPVLEPPTIPDDAFHALQLEAQSDIARGNVDAALAKYAQLIQQGQRLDQTMDDLSQAIANGLYSKEMVDILTDLGDAFLSLDRLQSALNAYTKAEEILM